MIDLEQYKAFTRETAKEQTISDTEGVDQFDAMMFNALGVNGEAGEVAEKIKRVRRGDGDPEDVAEEIGDVMWYLARIADEADLDLEEIILDNMSKLHSRQAADAIKGSGDDRGR